jgi:hypothetical protein
MLNDTFDPDKKITAATVRNYIDSLERETTSRSSRFPDAFGTGLGRALTRRDD